MEQDLTPGANPDLIGLVDGSTPATTRRFTAVLDEQSVVQLDELVASRQTLADGREVWHYGIVVEGAGEIEGADLASDTHRIAHAGTMPGVTARTVDVQVLRTMPELWLPPDPGAPVQRATANHRDTALFMDQMTHPLPIGVDQSNQPVSVDFSFLWRCDEDIVRALRPLHALRDRCRESAARPTRAQHQGPRLQRERRRPAPH